MNIENLVNISTSLKNIEITKITQDQQNELLSIVGILDVGALVLAELTESYNTKIDLLNMSKLEVETKEKLIRLSNPDWDTLISSFEFLKTLLVNGVLIEIKVSVDKLTLTKVSIIKALTYLQTLTYVFEDNTPKIILLS